MSAPARALPGVIVGVREAPEPLLAFVGSIDGAGRARLQELGGLLNEADTRLRVFTWVDVEQACARLAERLVRRLGRDELDSCSLVGVPRGGLIVAGLLAYALGTARDRVGAVHAGSTVIVVDDCVLSGVRLREVLAETAAARVVVAVLYAHPGLQAAVQATEPQVVACVAGGELHDHGPKLLGEYYGEWRRLWKTRVPERYQTALLDLVAFPWSAPQVRYWEPVSERIEESWRLIPAPGTVLGHSSCGLEVQVAKDQAGVDLLAPGVVPVVHADAVVLVDAEQACGVRLKGVAAHLWHAWVRDDSAAAAVVAKRYGQPVERVATDLRDLIAGLRARGLLADRTT